jgi:hypothetical protein
LLSTRRKGWPSRQTVPTTDLSASRELTNEIKESDLSAGRTLRDVHGNVVRVELHLLRPDDNTFQLLNLTKRSDYVYRDHQNKGWTYDGPAGSRLDIMDVTVRMNMALPDELSAWPGYIAGKGDEMHPEHVEVKFTNQEDEIKFTGDWKLRGQLDEENEVLEDDRLVFGSTINGWTVAPNYDAPDEGQDGSGEDNGEIWRGVSVRR